MDRTLKFLFFLLLGLAVCKLYTFKELQHQKHFSESVESFANYSLAHNHTAKQNHLQIKYRLADAGIRSSEVVSLADSLGALMKKHQLSTPQKIKQLFLKTGFVDAYQHSFPNENKKEWLAELQSLYFLHEGWRMIEDSITKMEYDLPPADYELVLTEMELRPKNKMSIDFELIEKLPASMVEVYKNRKRLSLDSFPIRQVKMGDHLEIICENSYSKKMKCLEKQY